MKVLFLDHDGVICLDSQWGSRFRKRKDVKYNNSSDYTTIIPDIPLSLRFDDFNTECVEILNNIITKTDCQIVVSSDWRRQATLAEMGEYYEQQGIIRKPIGYTPHIIDATRIFKHRISELEETRSYEILEWLNNNDEVTKWCAVDDMDMRKNSEWGLDNFVWTIGIGNIGLNQEGIQEKIIEYLN